MAEGGVRSEGILSKQISNFKGTAFKNSLAGFFRKNSRTQTEDPLAPQLSPLSERQLKTLNFGEVKKAQLPSDDIFRGSAETAAPEVRPFYPVLEQVASLLPDKLHGPTIYRGHHDGFQYAYELTGHKAAVGLVDITSPSGKKSEFVLRSHVEEARNYLDLARKYPLVRDTVPNLLGVIKGEWDWVILEKLKGAQNEEVREKLQKNPEFASLYAQKVVDLIMQSADVGLLITDVVFSHGQNMKVDENTAEIRLVEQPIFQPKEGYGNPSRERLIGGQLCKEYNGLVTRGWDYGSFDRKIVTQFRPNASPLFVFELTKALGRKVSLDSLPGDNSGVTDYKFAPDLIEAVNKNDFNQFQSILLRDDGGSPTHLVYTGKPLPRVEL